MKDRSPCADCKPPIRQPGCHAHCAIGKAYDRNQREKNETIKRERGKDKAFDCFKSERAYETKKKAGLMK